MLKLNEPNVEFDFRAVEFELQKVYQNQSRMCGKGVGLAFSLWLTRIPVIIFWCHCAHRTQICCRMIVENFDRIIRRDFRKLKEVQKWLFFGHFWANFGCFSHPSHAFWCHCAHRSTFGFRMTVQNYMETYRQFSRNSKFSLKGREKKRYVAWNADRIIHAAV